jgi:phospholipid-binding lipoprotein MlaA
MKLSVFLVFLLALSMSVAAAEDEYEEDDYEEERFIDPDPWVGLNRGTHNLNDFFDRKLVRPVAVGYRKVIPQFARTGVSNVFSNLEDIGDAINNVLQGKVRDGSSDVVRVLVNTTIGIAGFFDPASRMGLVDHEEDFGQTFGKWGVPTGPYFVIPALGPSSVRDGLARILDGSVNPLRYLYPVSHRNTILAFRGVVYRADLLVVDDVVFGDKYIFYRDAYFQRREYLLKDGEVSDPFADDF